MTRTIVPPIKCQGIKTKLVPWIKAILPTKHCGRWIEPFMGSGVVAFNVRPGKALLCDSNPHLINFYRAIASGEITPNVTRKFLTEEGKKLCESDGEYYYKVRERFNEKGAPLDFLFLNRSCFNGMIRFNRKGGFNVPFCRKPTRFAQAYVTKITNQVQAVAEICDSAEFEFRCQTFSETLAEASGNDLIYADPPYIDRHADYFNGWNEENERDLARLFAESNSQFILSTWHSNQYRANQFLDSIWSGYNMLTREHFYHVGAQEKNRNPMLEALVTNFEASITELEVTGPSQLSLFD